MNESATHVLPEGCDGGHHDLYEPVSRFEEGHRSRGQETIQRACLWYPDCRGKFTTNKDEDHEIAIGQAFWRLTIIDPCVQCGLYRCKCEERS